MRAWLAPLQRALDGHSGQVQVFFRDDDAGWADARLFQLLDLFGVHGMPIDLAVIPDALQPPLAAELLRRRAASAGRLGWHQHGRAHRNHQPEGRHCEFGPARTAAEVRADLSAGRTRLAGLLGPSVDPIFTPPWNRCSVETAHALEDLEYRVLSRDRTAPPFGLPGLRELPITVDWFARRPGVQPPFVELGVRLAADVDRPGPVGIMLHHAVTEAGDFQRLGELLSLLAGHPRVRTSLMLALVAEPVLLR